MDVGNYNCKFGYAGDDGPRCVFSGHVGVQRDDAAAGGASGTSSAAGSAAPSATRYVVNPPARLFRPRMDVRPLLDYGVVEDWDAMEMVWAHGFRELRCDMTERPVLLAEPAYSIAAQRERTAEVMFESFGVPALYLARQPVLGALSVGRASAIVVDLGHTATRVAPVYDGHVIQSEGAARGGTRRGTLRAPRRELSAARADGWSCGRR